MMKPWNSTTRKTTAAAVLALLFTGCATTEEPEEQPASSSVEIQQDVGFTITEDIAVAADVRLEYDEAVRYLEQGRHDEGIAALAAVAASAPRLSAPLIDLGIAYHQNDNLDSAEQTLLRAIELNPNHPTAHNELGIVYRKTGRFVEARQSYESALAIYPGYHFARRNLAVLCDLYLADLQCALDNYEAYMTTVPIDKEAEMWIADIRARLGQ
jgi:Flp pilus assembly protein TadD